METDVPQLDRLQSVYKAAVEEWLAAIKHETELASVNHDVAMLDLWEQAHFDEESIRNKVKAAKRRYEDALREQIYGF